MKRAACLAMAILALACGGGSDTASPPPAPATTMAPATTLGAAPVAPMSGEFAAEVVSIDHAAGTVTVRESAVGGSATASPAAGAAGQTTLRLDPGAHASLTGVKAGDRVTVICSLSGAGTGTTGGTAATGATGTTGTSGTTAAAPASGAAAASLAGCTSVTAVRKMEATASR